MLGRAAEERAFLSEHAELKEKINEHLWSEEQAFYLDSGYGRLIDRMHIGGFWTLIAEVVPEDRLEKLTAHLKNPQTFGRRMPVPTLSASDPDYNPAGGYWLGASWAPTTYAVLKGLAANGKLPLAKELAERAVRQVEQVYEETDTIWENYAPDKLAQGVPGQRDFCGWSGLFTVAIPREFLSESGK